MSATLGEALRLGRSGLYVFPCKPGQKVPLRGSHGLHDATTDPDGIRGWWTRMPAANVAIACEPSHLGVVDLDGAEGITTWRTLTAQYPTARTLTVRTPSGGAHLYYADPDNRLRSTSRQVGAGVDTRGRGGYVIAPPSQVKGRSYTWCTPPELGALPPVPPWLLYALQPAERTPAPVRSGPLRGRYVERAVEGEVQAVLDAPVGGRNAQLNRSAFNLGTLVGAALLDQADAVQALVAAGEAAGLNPREVGDGHRGTVASGMAAGMAHPRAVKVNA